MPKLHKDYKSVLEEVFEEFGVTEWKITQDGRHPRVRFVMAGQVVRYVLPGSPGDRRGALNCRADLRRLCRQRAGDPRGTLST